MRSRKRKLCELYAVTAAPYPAQPTPKTFDSYLDPFTDPNLARFLEQNDIERYDSIRVMRLCFVAVY